MHRHLALATSFIFFALAGTLRATEPWQSLQNPTASQVQNAWQSPPPEYGPEPYYGLNGPVTIEQVERDLDTMKRLGFQAVTVQAGYNTPFAYLSPEYFAFFRKFVDAAKARNMRVWIVDDAGYPSGFAGGRFSSSAPSLRMQALEVTQQISVAAGTTLHQSLAPDVVSAAAVDADGHATPISLHNNSLTWTAPPGNWTVLLVDHEFRTSPTRSDTNPHRVKDTSQSLEDYLNPAATAQYLAWTHAQYKHYVGDEFGKTILGFRGDEPDFSIPGLPWTPAFFARFRALKGYDVQPFTALFAQTPSRRNPGIKIQLTPEQLRIKADYYDVFSLLFAAGFFKPQADWCAANNLEYQVHLNHEELEMELTHSEGSFFRDMRFVQVPGIDAIWHQIWTDTIADYPRLASSASHVYGHPRAFTESFAAYRPTPDVTMARYILNEQFVRGVNLVEMMYFPATSSGPKPPPSFMGQPGFSDLTTYVRRMSYLLSMGRPDAHVALYLPASSMWLGDDTADTQFVSTERLLSEHQIDFDIVSDDALAHDLTLAHGAFTTRSGNRYSTIILPTPELLSETAFTRLRTFAHNGGHVLFLGGTPQFIAARTIRDARTVTPADFRWATIVDAQLPATPTPGQFPPTTPPAAQSVPPEILRALNASAHATIRTATTDRSSRHEAPPQRRRRLSPLQRKRRPARHHHHPIHHHGQARALGRTNRLRHTLTGSNQNQPARSHPALRPLRNSRRRRPPEPPRPLKSTVSDRSASGALRDNDRLQS
ncbi:MAG TPA: glycosyl hydrolase [Bryocella sp.]|nr:glycosyl hydrolase [Bryocella sp.]